MYLDKISLKITPFQWRGLYDFLFTINAEVTEKLNGRHAQMEVGKYVLFDLCRTQTNTVVYHRWLGRIEDKYYTMHLPIGQAVTLVNYCFNISYLENPALNSFISTLYGRLTSYVSPHQFSMPVENSLKLLR